MGQRETDGEDVEGRDGLDGGCGCAEAQPETDKITWPVDESARENFPDGYIYHWYSFQLAVLWLEPTIYNMLGR